MCSTFFDTLIITGGLAPESFPMEGCKYAKVIAADSGYDTAKRLGITPTDVIGDFDSTACRDELLGKGYKPFPRDKDQTDTELAIMMRSGGFDILGGGGGRLDHIFSILSLFRVYGMPRYWFTDCDVIMGLDAGKAYLDADIGTDFSVMPLCADAHVESDGFMWELGKRDLDLSFISQSNRNVKNHVLICTDKPIMIRTAIESFRPGMIHLL